MKAQKAFFDVGRTRDVDFRKQQLDILRREIADNREDILTALQRDLSKSAYEGYLTEVGIVLDEIRFVRKRLTRWARPRRVRTNLFLVPASSYRYAEPYGVVLIIAPWNYPFQLVMGPLIGAMAAGNCAVIKPSEFAPNTSRVIAKLISRNFDPAYIAACEGHAEVSQALLDQPFDYVFFTGSVAVGKLVMQAAARRLTPVTLELGGKSPCIVDRDIELKITARRIVSGKFINAGQTCIAPDYLLVHHEIKDRLIESIKDSIHDFFGDDPKLSPDYPRIVNEKHFQRLVGLMQFGSVIVGGQSDLQNLYIAPTVIDEVSWGDPIMENEIFGPILPVLSYENLQETIAQIKKLPRPLALYSFSNNRQLNETILADLSFGGGCINDTLLHFANPHLPFGGVGNSGIGSYHGQKSFETFSHRKSILKRSFRLDAPLRYPPYGNKLKFLERILR
ncbi:MAG: aldehyde dehydrogenase [Desulfobacterales bacterium]|nr:aldehyde dehydrogenase [Desulfobacterales bacterium]